jgi:hypothetical protein
VPNLEEQVAQLRTQLEDLELRYHVDVAVRAGATCRCAACEVAREERRLARIETDRRMHNAKWGGHYKR